MRKKFTMLLASLFLTLGTAWAQTAEVQGSTTVDKPEHQYVMKSGNNYWMAANTAPTKHALGRFAFFAVTETDDANDYKIYSIDLKKWVSYNKAGGYSNCKDFAKLVDDQEGAQPWNVVKITVSNVDYYQIAPYNNTGVAAKYMNWNGGINNSGYSYNDTRTVGLWEQGAAADAGSRWTLAACPDFGSIADGEDIATTWTPSSWWTTTDYGGSNVLDAVKAVETAQYPTGNSNVMMRYMHMQVPAGRLDVTLNFTGGNNRLDIVGVDLLNTKGEVVVSDYHFGFSGNNKHLHTYTLPVETAGSYTLRYWVTFKREENTSTGDIAIAHTSVKELKDAAKAELDKLAKLSIVTVGDAKTQIDAVEANPNASINAILVDVKKSVDGKNVRFTTYGRNTTNGSDITAASNGTFFTTLSGDAGIWTLKSNDDGTFKLYNFLSNLYLGITAGDGKHLATCSDFAAAGSYTFNPISENKTNLQNNGNSLHADGYGKVVQWNPDHTTAEASIWSVISCEPIAITRELYDQATTAKASLPYAFQQAYGLVTDAAKYTSNALQQNPAEGSYANLLDNNYQSYFHTSWSAVIGADHYLQAEVSREVKDFVFYFKKRHETNNNRPTTIEIQGSSDGQAFTTIETINEGLPTDEKQVDYFSGTISATENIKYIRFVVKATNSGDLDNKYSQENPKPEGNPFFHFSEFYIFPVMPDITNLIEAYNKFSTLSITNSEITNAATALLDAEKTLELANIKKEVDALLKANESNHSDTPAIGQYTTTAYNELDAAYKDGEATQESLEAAIAKFEKAKNRPVFTIGNGNVKEYAKGKSIYDDNSGSLYFKTTDVYDKTMWWALDLNKTAVEVANEVGIYNVATGNGFLGVTAIKITETSENENAGIPDDNIFLFYKKGGEHPVHFQESESKIVEYRSYEATSGSAAVFTYIGNTYDLNQLTDEKIVALQALKTAVDAKSYLTKLQGSGVGQYNMADDEFNTYIKPLSDASAVVEAALSEQAVLEVSAIEGYTSAVNAMPLPSAEKLNLPIAGKYYRIKGANAGAENYLTGNVTVNGNHIALQADKTNATIFRYVNSKLLAVESNLYVAMTESFYTFQILEKNAPNITFAASSRKAGAYTINSGRYFHYNSNNTEGTFLDRCSSDPNDHTAHDWYLEEVPESEVPVNTNLLTDIANLSAEASYRIYGDRGFIYVADDGNMKGTNNVGATYNPNNDKHHFAIVTIGENKYLYNVGTKKFVKKNGTGGVALTDWPELAITIESKEKANENSGFDWVIKSDGSRLNLSNADGHTFGIYTNHNTEDPGNVWAIYKVGTFDPTEAQSMKKVTVNYTVDGQAFTKNYGVADNALNFAYDFATVKSCQVGEEAQEITDGACSVTVQDNMTIDVEIVQDLPFEAAQAVDNIPTSAWRYLQMHSNNKKYIQYLSGQSYIEWADVNIDRAEEKSHTWALVGNVVEGFKLVNLEAGTSKALKSTGSGEPAMGTYANGTSFVLVNTIETSAAAQNGFCLQYPGGSYLNAQDGRIKHYSNTDAGSTLVASPILNQPEPGFYYISNAGEYLSDDIKSVDKTQRVLTTEVSAKNIFYYDGTTTTLIAYASGFGFEYSICNTHTAGVSNAFTFGISSEPGKYTVKSSNGSSTKGFANRYWKNKGNKELDFVEANNADNASGWDFEEVTELPVTISSVGYGTLWAPVALEIPEHVKAYTGTLNADEDVLELTKITTGIIPANTGVVIYHDGDSYGEDEVPTGATTHNFAITSTTETLQSDFSGSVATIASSSATNPYTLQTHDGGVAFKKFTGTNITGFKAYLEFENAQKAQALRIRFAGEQGGTATEIEMPIANGQQPTAIYDLQGRRVLNPTKGMYIVNGKKVLF